MNFVSSYARYVHDESMCTWYVPNYYYLQLSFLEIFKNINLFWRTCLNIGVSQWEKKIYTSCCKSMCLQLLTIFRVEPTFLREIKWFLNTVIWKVDLIIKTVNCKHVYLHQGSNIKKTVKRPPPLLTLPKNNKLVFPLPQKKPGCFPCHSKVAILGWSDRPNSIGYYRWLKRLRAGQKLIGCLAPVNLLLFHFTCDCF
jgi:hypothetical protein